MLAHMRIALGSQQLQRQKGQQVAQRRNLPATRQPSGLNNLREPQLRQKRRKQKHPGRG